MSVKINIPPFLQHLANDVKVAEAKGSTVGECLNDLVNQFPHMEELLFDENGNLVRHVDVYVNGESAYPEDLAKPVNDRDELYILLVIVGG